MSKIIKIGDKYYDFGTKNQSFLETAYELKTLGIKNFYFMLEVKYPNTGVQDIDPYKENITPQEIAAIGVECKQNPWFFFREVAKVPVGGAPKPFMTFLHRASCAMVWCYLRNIDFMVCQPRQTYKTTWITLITEYFFIFEAKKIKIPFMHLTEKDVIKNVTDFRDYINTLPYYLNPWFGTKVPGVKSIRDDRKEHLNSLKIVTQAESPEKARDKLRGDTIFVGFIDEWEYIAYINEVIAGGAPAMISGRVICEETLGRTCMMYASTPGDLETDTGVSAQHIIDMTPQFKESLYDATDKEIQLYLITATHKFDDNNGTEVHDELMDSMKDPMANGTQSTILYIEFNYKQLRKDEAWVRTQYLKALQSGKIAEYRRGILLDRFRGGDAALFDQRDIDYIKSITRSPDNNIIIKYAINGKVRIFHLDVYKHPINQGDLSLDEAYFDIYIPYLIGIDVSSGGNGDNTAICVVHPYTLQVVAELQSPYIGLFDLMRIITFLAKLIPSGVFCVETNSVGKAIVDFVQETRLEHRFYHDPELDMSKNAVMMQNDASKFLEAKANAKQYIGTYVTPKVRANMIDLLKLHVHDYRHLINTYGLVKDITALVKIKGKVQAGANAHDDLVMAYLHTLYVLYYGFDISRFGIDKSRCVFKKPAEIVKEFEKEQDENTVDNTKQYDQPTMYEGQLLDELMGRSSEPMISTMTGTDDYGYSARDYIKNSPEYQRQPEPGSEDMGLSASDYEFLNAVNTFY